MSTKREKKTSATASSRCLKPKISNERILLTCLRAIIASLDKCLVKLERRL
ncbi:MAG: hypothetical protein ACOYXY_21955 [Thermodesulfobacteriota bacterium]